MREFHARLIEIRKAIKNPTEYLACNYLICPPEMSLLPTLPQYQHARQKIWNRAEDAWATQVRGGSVCWLPREVPVFRAASRAVSQLQVKGFAGYQSGEIALGRRPCNTYSLGNLCHIHRFTRLAYTG